MPGGKKHTIQLEAERLLHETGTEANARGFRLRLLLSRRRKACPGVKTRCPGMPYYERKPMPVVDILCGE